jgi:hypothetical protein
MADEPPAAPPPELPTRSTLINWLRVNFALLSFLAGIAVASAGSLIGVGAWLSDNRHDMDSIKDRLHAIDGESGSLGEQHRTNIDLDRRINEINTSRNTARREVERDITDAARSGYEARRDMEKEISALESRINRLEAQMQFVGDRVQQAQTGRRP